MEPYSLGACCTGLLLPQAWVLEWLPASFSPEPPVCLIVIKAENPWIGLPGEYITLSLPGQLWALHTPDPGWGCLYQAAGRAQVFLLRRENTKTSPAGCFRSRFQDAVASAKSCLDFPKAQGCLRSSPDLLACNLRAALVLDPPSSVTMQGVTTCPRKGCYSDQLCFGWWL